MRSIIKSNGRPEPFSSEKFLRSLNRAGISSKIAQTLLTSVLDRPELDTTYKIYQFAFNELRNINRAHAARYSLKNALYELGPEGFLFEKFMAELFKAQGFSTRTDQTILGKCVNHEIDIIMKKDGKQFMAECKFHNSRGIKTDVKVALYIKARYEDIKEYSLQRPSEENRCDGYWLLTNTQLTTEAIRYGECVGIRMFAWAYPEKGNIAQLIDELGLHPLTSLTSLTSSQKRALLNQNILFAHELGNRTEKLQALGLNKREVNAIIAEAQELNRQS